METFCVGRILIRIGHMKIASDMLRHCTSDNVYGIHDGDGHLMYMVGGMW